MLKDVLEFNRIRNGFEFNMTLEVDMLQEEIREFFDAKNLAERVDALTDTSYVYEGAKMKCAYNASFINADIEKWVTESVEIMMTILIGEIGGEALTAEILIKAQKIVADINAIKISELDKNGKVKKQKNLPNATLYIAEMLLLEHGIDCGYEHFSNTGDNL